MPTQPAAPVYLADAYLPFRSPMRKLFDNIKCARRRRAAAWHARERCRQP